MCDSIRPVGSHLVSVIRQTHSGLVDSLAPAPNISITSLSPSTNLEVDPSSYPGLSTAGGPWTEYVATLPSSKVPSDTEDAKTIAQWSDGLTAVAQQVLDRLLTLIGLLEKHVQTRQLRDQPPWKAALGFLFQFKAAVEPCADPLCLLHLDVVEVRHQALTKLNDIAMEMVGNANGKRDGAVEKLWLVGNREEEIKEARKSLWSATRNLQTTLKECLQADPRIYRKQAEADMSRDVERAVKRLELCGTLYRADYPAQTLDNGSKQQNSGHKSSQHDAYESFDWKSLVDLSPVDPPI
jgi:hypothetical protein